MAALVPMLRQHDDDYRHHQPTTYTNYQCSDIRLQEHVPAIPQVHLSTVIYVDPKSARKGESIKRDAS